jgi:formyl-CoA transferase
MRFSRSTITRGNAGPALGQDTERVLAEIAEKGAAGSARAGAAGAEKAEG